jgi:hypothetical protein
VRKDEIEDDDLSAVPQQLELLCVDVCHLQTDQLGGSAQV